MEKAFAYSSYSKTAIPFVTHYFCGEYEEAAKYLERMEYSEWCWNCTRKDCTEVWECKGYMALYEGQEEEAVR